MQRVSAMHGTGFLASPFPPTTPGLDTRRPPDELMCLNDDVGVADSGGSRRGRAHSASIKHPKHIAGLDADLGPTFNCDLDRRLTPKGSQIGQPVVQMILVHNQNHDMISLIC